MKKVIEYGQMAKYYDLFYKNKNYSSEICFIENFINTNDCKILDAGCGTGNHALLLYKKGYDVVGFDLNKEMVDIANEKLAHRFSVNNILNFKSNDKYDLIISFFAVFNHLKSYRQFRIALNNLKSHLNKNGTIIIDLHNPQSNGVKKEKFGEISRTMKWKVNKLFKKEYTHLVYDINGQQIVSSHTFKIFTIKKIKNLLNGLSFKNFEFYENYNIQKHASSKSKNIQVVIYND